MTTVAILYSEIPDYLRAGEFFRSLHEDPESVIEIPSDCFPSHGQEVINLEEFCLLLRVMRCLGAG